MAGAPQTRTPDSRNYVEYAEYVDFQLDKTRAIVKRTDILTTLMALAVGVIGYLLAFVVFDQWIIDGGFGYASRVVLLVIVAAVVLVTLAWRVMLPLLRQVHPLYAARVIEQSDPKLKSNLVNFVDVKLANAESAPVVLKSMQKRAAVELSHIDVEEAVDHRPLLRIAYALLGLVIVAALYIFISPKNAFVSVRRALLPTSPIAVATKTEISDVDPGDKDVPARTRQVITAEVHGEQADEAQILFTTADHKYVNEPVKMRRETAGLSKFVGELNGENGKGLLQSLTYRIVAGDARTTDYTINVIQPPSARVDEVHYVFPKYTELEEKTTSGGDIDGWEGTIVTVKATANMKVAEARIVLTDSDDKSEKGEEILMQVADGTLLTGTWKLEFRSDGTSPRYYHIRVKTENQKKDEIDSDPTQYTLRIRADQRPDVALLDPTGDLTRPANAIIPLVVQAADPDFKIRSVILRGTRGSDSLFVQDVKLFDDELPARSVAGKYNFRLEPLGLKPGDRIQFWIEAKDNKQPTANRTNTTPINVTIDKPVSEEEVQKQLAKDEQAQQEQLERSKDGNNPEVADKEKSEPRDGDKQDERAQPRKEQPDPAVAQPKDKDEPAYEENENGDRKFNKNTPDQQRKPTNNDEALSRLLKKQQQDHNNQNSDDKQEQQDQQNSTDRTQQQRGDGEGQSGQGNSKGQKQAKSDQSKSGNDRGAENSPDGDRPGNQTKPGDDNSDSEKGDSHDKKSGGTGKKQQSPANAGDKNQQRDKAASENKTGENSDPVEGDKAGESPRNAKDKSQPMPGSEGEQDDKGRGDKSKTGKKSENGENAGSDDQKPGAKSGTKKDEQKTDGAGDNSDQENRATKNAAGKDQSPKADGASDPSQPEGGADKSKKDKSGKDKNATKGAGEEGDDQQPGNASDKKQPGAKPEGSGEDDRAAGDQQNPKEKNKQQGGAGKKPADKSEGGGDSKDDQQGQGTPGQSDKNEGDQQPGDAGGDKSPKNGKGPKKAGGDSDPKGPEKPAEDDGTAKDKPATGNEEGEGTTDEGRGDRQNPRASDKVKKKEGAGQGSKKDAADGDRDAQKAKQKRGADEGAEGGTDDAEHAERAPDDKKNAEKPGKLDSPPSEKGVERRKEGSEKRPGQNPDVDNQQMKGKGREKGQKSEQSDPGEQGSGVANDEGKKGANKAGRGDKSDEPGNTDPSNEKTGEPGSQQKGKGSATKPSDDGQGQKQEAGGDNPGDKAAGQKGKNAQGGKQGQGKDDGESGDGKPSGESGGKKGGNQSGQGGKDSGDQPGGQDASGKSSQPGGKPGSGQQRSGSGISSNPGQGNQPGDGENPEGEPRERQARTEPPTAEEEAADLENAKKATNLVLKRLKSQLERGDVDQEMLDEMGWKDNKDVEKFVRYLEDNLKQNADDDSPEAQARRMQFEETLRNLDVGSETNRRSGSVGKERAIQQIGTKNVPPPREYQKIWESYTRSLSKQSEKSEPKANDTKKTDANWKALEKTKKAGGKK